MHKDLTELQIKLAEQLLITIVNKEPNVTYQDLAERVTPPIHHRQVGRNIGEISKVCYKLGLPFISAKVMNKHQHKAGYSFYGFYKMYGIDTQGKTEKELFSWELKKIRECTEWYKLADELNIDIDLPRPNEKSKSNIISKIEEKNNQTELSENLNEQIQIFPDEIPYDNLNKYIEGAKKQVIVNAYERNSKARQACIKIYGDNCIICGFNFEKFYGSEFKGKIHVHHKKPLSEVNKNYEINPEQDLVPVCPNCHLILHSKRNGHVFSVEEVKEFTKGKSD